MVAGVDGLRHCWIISSAISQLFLARGLLASGANYRRASRLPFFLDPSQLTNAHFKQIILGPTFKAAWTSLSVTGRLLIEKLISPKRYALSKTSISLPSRS